MAYTLAKGSTTKIRTTKGDNLTRVRAGLSWDMREDDGPTFDLDLAAFLLNEQMQLAIGDPSIVFYQKGYESSLDGALRYSGDNLDGSGKGDDEWIDIDLTKIPETIDSIALVASIYDAEARNQTFSLMSSAKVTLSDATREGSAPLYSYALSDVAAGQTAFVMGYLTRENGEWVFKADSDGYATGFPGVIVAFGGDVE